MSNCTCNCHQPRPITEAEAARYWAKVDIRGKDECWNWTAATNDRGYGRWGLSYQTNTGAHRWAYLLTYGELPEGMMVDHLCFNRLCSNPSHLRLATPAENSQNRQGATVLSKSGHRGVSWKKSAGLWVAKAGKDGKVYQAGYFKDLDEAVTAVKALRARLYGTEAA